MNITELIAECEILQKPLLSDPSHGVGFRSWKLLPLLVAVIKNQQRQIEILSDAASSGHFDFSHVNKIAAELEDVKPC